MGFADTLQSPWSEAHRPEPRRPEPGLMTESPVAIRYDHQGTWHVDQSAGAQCRVEPILHRMRDFFHSGSSVALQDANSGGAELYTVARYIESLYSRTV